MSHGNSIKWPALLTSAGHTSFPSATAGCEKLDERFEFYGIGTGIYTKGCRCGNIFTLFILSVYWRTQFVQQHPFLPVKKQEQKQVETDRSLDSLKSFVQSDQQNKQRDLGETQT